MVVFIYVNNMFIIIMPFYLILLILLFYFVNCIIYFYRNFELRSMYKIDYNGFTKIYINGAHIEDVNSIN